MSCPEEEELLKCYYKFGKMLGRGQFSTVQLCRDRKTNTEFAMKKIKKAKMLRNKQDPQREAIICGKLIHPNIVRLHNVIQGDTYMYLILDYVPCGELFHDIETRSFYCEEDAAYCMRQIVEAIDYCHSIGIVHRDLKPENILLVTKGTNSIIKIIDFGLSIELVGDEQEKFGTCGSIDYMSPEVIKNEIYGKPIDLWACGTILYLLLSGETPFRDPYSTVFTHHSYGREFDKVSNYAKTLINSMLKKIPNERITISEALKHRFFYGDRGNAPAECHLASAVQNIEKFNFRRKLKASFHAIRLTNSFKKHIRSKRVKSKE